MALLALIRYNATRLPRLGALFTNPGGPGGSGVEDILYFGETYGNQTGGFYDIISELTVEIVIFSHLITLCFQAGTLEVGPFAVKL